MQKPLLASVFAIGLSIAGAASWLIEDGMFVASLDLHNLKFADGREVGRKVTSELRRSGLEYDRRRRSVICRGRKPVDLPFRYLGADDRAGPNYTRQPAVDSHYEVVPGPTRERSSRGGCSRPADPRTGTRPAGSGSASGSRRGWGRRRGTTSSP